MPGQKQPIELLLANGRKHLTKEEIEDRQASEPKPCEEGIKAPSYLTAAQKKKFDEIAGQLKKIKIMGETDNEALARYVTAQSLYEEAVRDLRKVHKMMPKSTKESAGALIGWTEAIETLDKRQDRYFHQAQSAAKDLGLTISSRCRLEVPHTEETPKVNKYTKFRPGAGTA